ncbi:hypothetical protein C8R45DRAFT_1010751 [Mycena sanguinolenta]|nr:hypothetical protein C8R45DRAFT_1010751 [Mycena sanguinolenta]
MASPPALQPAAPDPIRSTDVLRDTDYYYPSGDSIIRVENTLFKIHKFVFVHHSPVFATMFDLPVGIGSPEGLSDDLPIVLEGENAGDFRLILKYIYASPLQTQIHSMTMAELPEVISVARFSHKYAMDGWKKWALKVVHRQLADINVLPAEYLSSLYSLFTLFNLNFSTRARLMGRWCQVVEDKKLPIVPVLAAADAARDNDALVEVYCLQIRRWEKSRTIPPEPPTQDGISPAHFQRMLVGHASLTLWWNRLRGEPSSTFQSAGCGRVGTPEFHAERCIPYCRMQWISAIMEAEQLYPHVTQIARRLSHLAKHREQNNPPFSSQGKLVACFNAVLTRFNRHVQETHMSLASHFFPKSQSPSQ